MIGIRCEHLTKTFEGTSTIVKPVDDLTIEFQAGQISAIIGESGCGKTTLLRLIAGLEFADSGRVVFGQLHRKPVISMVFQEPRLFPWFTVEQNIALSVRQLPSQEQRKKVENVLELVGLRDFRHALPSELSGGMAQRVGLARALCPLPDILLLDEAFSGLDALTRRRIYGEFIRIHQRAPITTILVTHDVMEAVLLSSNVYRFADGRCQQQFNVDFDYPRTLATEGLGELSETILDQFLHTKKEKK
ncbi:MAG: ABC transporter ATP-binding protein [Sutterella sp.]|nr:ABC transporter ATP-binding protein [Sutterella sp.]